LLVIAIHWPRLSRPTSHAKILRIANRLHVIKLFAAPLVKLNKLCWIDRTLYITHGSLVFLKERHWGRHILVQDWPWALCGIDYLFPLLSEFRVGMLSLVLSISHSYSF
jgi:hypothetical protein